MSEEDKQNGKSLWKKFERVSGIVALLAALTVIIGFYYQVHSKKNEITFQIISKDYLTNNNNVDQLKSNYVYAGIPVKHLWLLKLKVVNTGDLTLIGQGVNSSLLDSNITFKFPSNIQILNRPSLISNNFPDHQLKRIDSNSISLSFQQWRSGEFAVYSVYLKSNSLTNKFVPTSKRMIKDGDILIEDISNDQSKNRIPLLDRLFISPWTLIFRGLGIILGLIIVVVITLGVVLEIRGWFSVLKWKSKYGNIYKSYLTGGDLEKIDSNFNSIFTKDEFLNNKKSYIKNPIKLAANNNFWKNSQIPKVPSENSIIQTWNSFYILLLIYAMIFVGGLGIILGLWLH